MKNLLFLIIVFMPSLAFPYDIIQKKIHVTGSVIDTACSVDMDSIDQSVNLGTLPLSTVIDQAHQPDKKFSVRLDNCSLARHDGGNDFKGFSINFMGTGDDGMFLLSGKARGVALEIKDYNGQIIHPGIAVNTHKLENGNITMDYYINIISNGEKLNPGDYSGNIEYRLDYY